MSAVKESNEIFADISHHEAVSDLQEDMRGKHLEALAKDGAANEHNTTAMQALKAYPAAVFWTFMVSMCVIMEGYDTILIGNFYAYPTFAKKYGSFDPSTKTYQLSAAWQAGLGNAAGVGSFFGVLANGRWKDSNETQEVGHF
jgi:SP family general alpha glucoside:H+ symporter-like MFS transporter